ncbi:MAG TPA: universal stress protein [Jatrophihabitans sp.]
MTAAQNGVDGDVVVFVDGTEEAWYAFNWAHDEARRTGRALCVAHVDPHGDAQVVADSGGDDVLAEAAARLADIESPVQVDTRRYCETFQNAVSHASERAALIVVGSGSRHLLQPRLIGRTHGLLGRTTCPMVVMAANARPDLDGVITIGVSLSPGGLAALRFGCTEARRSGRAVVGVRAWSDSDWRLDAIDDDYTPAATWRSIESVVLEQWLERARAQFPDLTIDGALVDSPVYWALEDRAPSSALIVVGARRARIAMLPPLGPVTSWAVHHAGGAVAVVPFDTDGDDEPDAPGPMAHAADSDAAGLNRTRT